MKLAMGFKDVLGRVVIHDKGVITGGPQIIGTPYHDGALVSKYGFNNFKYWLTARLLDFVTTSYIIHALGPCKGAQSP